MERYNGKAIGIFEVDNLVAGYVALDAASKAADVRNSAADRRCWRPEWKNPRNDC